MPLNPAAATPPPVVTLNNAGIAELADALIQRATDANQRAVLAIAGVPGSGKSTLAICIAAKLNQARPGSALVYPMDGLHLPNDKLVELGLRNRKGAPQTFDARGYIKLLTQLRDASRSVRIPVFDRDLDDAVFTGKPEHTADHNTRYIVTEGNYLLLESMPWNAIEPLAELTVYLDTPTDQAHRWIIERHTRFGRTREQAEAWYQSNDKLNTQTVQQHSRHADRIAR